MSMNIWVLQLSEHALQRLATEADLDVEELLEELGTWGVEVVGDPFEGAYDFFEDLRTRMSGLAAAPWLQALGDGEGRLPDTLPPAPGLQQLTAAGWVILSAAERTELAREIQAALAADAEWARAEHQNGPTWAALAAHHQLHRDGLWAFVI